MKQTLLGLRGKLGVWSVDPPHADQSFADSAMLSNCPQPTIFVSPLDKLHDGVTWQ